METQTTPQNTKAEKLFRLGFTEAAANLKTLMAKKKKLALAYEHYRFITPENILKFNAKLRDAEYTGTSGILGSFSMLILTPIQNYKNAPPDNVLESLEKAQDRQCFDSFFVAHIETVKDPLLFGKIDGAPNYFFIDQWDDDVSIDDLLKENEG